MPWIWGEVGEKVSKHKLQLQLHCSYVAAEQQLKFRVIFPEL